MQFDELLYEAAAIQDLKSKISQLETENQRLKQTAYIKQNCTVLTQTVRPVFTETEYKCNDGSTRKVTK